VHDDIGMDEQTGGFSAAPIIAAAAAAGIAAFLIRRSRRSEERIETPATVAAAAWQKAKDEDFRREAVSTTRDWLWSRLLPELKPIMLDLLQGVKELTDQGFKRAEKAVKDL